MGHRLRPQTFSGPNNYATTALTSGYVHTDDYVVDGVYDVGVLERAFADAQNRGKILMIGHARTAGGDRTEWVLNRKVLLTGPYIAIVFEAGAKLRFTHASPNDAYFELDRGSNGGQSYSGYIKNPIIEGPGRRTDKSVLLRFRRLTNFTAYDLQLNNCDAGLDFRGNCFLSVIRGMRTNFNTLNVPLIVAGTRSGSVAQSGSDISFYDLMITGKRAAIFFDGNQGGFHFYSGQFNSGTDELTVQPNRGIIEAGYDYLHPDFVYQDPNNIYAALPNLNGYAPAGVSHVNFYSPSFEGAWWGDVLYAHEGFFGELHSPNINASKSGAQAMRGIAYFRNPQTSRLTITGAPRLGGTFRERELYKSLSSNIDGLRITETQFSTKLGDLSIAGQGFGPDALRSPMMYQGFTQGVASSLSGTDLYELNMGTLYKTPRNAGAKVYFVNWPNLSETTNSVAGKGLATAPIDRDPTQPHGLVWTGTAYPARPPTGFAHYIGPTNPKTISGLSFIKGDRWSAVSL